MEGEGGPAGPGLPLGKTISLTVVRGPDAGTKYEFAKPVVVIGRKRGDFPLTDRETSGVHAQVEVAADGRIVIKDLGSTNGTFVDGRRVDIAELVTGQQLKCGANYLLFTVAEDDGVTVAGHPAEPPTAAPFAAEFAPAPEQQPAPPPAPDPPAEPAPAPEQQPFPPPAPDPPAVSAEAPAPPPWELAAPSEAEPAPAVPAMEDLVLGETAGPGGMPSMHTEELEPIRADSLGEPSLPPAPAEPPAPAPSFEPPPSAPPPAEAPLSAEPAGAPAPSFEPPPPPGASPPALEPPPLTSGPDAVPPPPPPRTGVTSHGRRAEDDDEVLDATRRRAAMVPDLNATQRRGLVDGELAEGSAAAPDPPATEAAGLPPGVERSVYGLYLVVERGRDAGSVFPIHRDVTVIGRSQTDVVLNDPDISRRHAALDVQGRDKYLLRDLKSTNGTLLNGRAVSSEPIADNDKIRVGGTTLKFVVGEGRVAAALSRLG